jgi:Ca2+-binding EF-hand superfamily protein
MENDQLAQSEADAGRVTKAQVLKFLELQFSLVDIDKDGALDIHELRTLVNALSHPDIDVKQTSLTHDTWAASPKNAQGLSERK